MARAYDRRAVEALIHAVWDEQAAFGIRKEETPEPGSPKAPSDPAHSNTLYAMLADIRRAWDHASIPLAQRQSLLLHFGLGYEPVEAGYILGVTKQATQYRIDQGVGRLAAFMNAERYTTDYESKTDASVHVCDQEGGSECTTAA